MDGRKFSTLCFPSIFPLSSRVPHQRRFVGKLREWDASSFVCSFVRMRRGNDVVIVIKIIRVAGEIESYARKLPALRRRNY